MKAMLVKGDDVQISQILFNYDISMIYIKKCYRKSYAILCVSLTPNVFYRTPPIPRKLEMLMFCTFLKPFLIIYIY